MVRSGDEGERISGFPLPGGEKLKSRGYSALLIREPNEPPSPGEMVFDWVVYPIFRLPPRVVTGWLGNSTTRVTQDTYQHVLPEMLEWATGRLDAIFRQQQRSR